MKTSLKTIIALVIFFFISSALRAQYTLEVTIKGIQEIKGTIRVSLFTNDVDFLKKAIEVKVLRVTATESKVEFTNLKNGKYAVSVIQDLNENEMLDSNFMGIPKEPYGFSNNVMGNFGPPDFEKAKIQLDSNQSCSISLRK